MMDLIKSPSRAGCLAASLAMVLDKTYDEIIGLLGHDGTEVIFPELNVKTSREPQTNSLRGFTEWEMVELLLQQGQAAIPIVAAPAIVPPGRPDIAKVLFTEDQVLERLSKHMQGNVGIICGWIAADRKHACAWDGEKVYDPKEPRIYGFDDAPDTERIAIETFYRVLPIDQRHIDLYGL